MYESIIEHPRRDLYNTYLYTGFNMKAVIWIEH